MNYKIFIMTKVICLMNQKGGVGKTATTVHLGAFLAEKGFKTLIIDLDAQTDTTRSLQAVDDNYSAYDLLTDSDKSISFYNHTSSENLFVLVGNRNIKEIAYKKNMLVDKINLLKKYFDYILIDCNPHLIEFNRVALNEVVLTASDFVVIPTESDPNSIYDTNLFIPDVLKVKQNNNPKLVLLGVLFSKVEVNTKLFREAFFDFQNVAKDLVFESYIRKDEKMRHSQLNGQTIFEFDRKSNASLDFIDFGNEFLNKIKKYE